MITPSLLGDLCCLVKKLTRKVIVIFFLYIIAHIFEAVILSMDVNKSDDIARTVTFGIIFFLGQTYCYFPPIAIGSSDQVSSHCTLIVVFLF